MTRLRRQQAGVDAYREPVYQWVPTELRPALFSPGSTAARGNSSAPVADLRVAHINTPTLRWFGHHPDITVEDRIVVHGVEYAINAEPQSWDHPGGLCGTTVSLRKEVA